MRYNGLMHRFVLSLVSGATLVTSASWVTLSAQNDTVGVHGVVTTVPAGGLIRKPANFFDLEGTTVTFTPNDAGEYAVTVGNLDWRDPVSGAETVSGVLGWYEYLTVDLPFSFPFAGQTWTRVYANTNGNISFQRPERMNRPHRVRPAVMRSLAAAVDSRSTAGLETMIAALWAIYRDPTVTVDSSETRVVITWGAVRRQGDASGYVPLGENLFQARLYPSGAIELGYQTVPERDGIVGLFHGLSTRGRTLDSFDDPAGDVANAALDIVRIEFVDNDSTVLARMTLAGDVPTVMHDGEISYRITLHFSGTECSAGIIVGASGWRPFLDRCPDPDVVGYRVDGTTIEIPISKTLLNGSDRFAWDADAVWWGRQDDQLFEDRTVYVGKSDRDLRGLTGTTSGNLFEVFHYPTMPKLIEEVLSFVYERVPANDEIAVAFTDFRVDDLTNTGAGTGPVNAPIQGIGEGQAKANSGKHFGSDSLLVSMRPVFIGAPNFNETGVSLYSDRTFWNFAPGVGWIAHEAVHRWAAHLDFRNPRSGRVESLTNGGVHWSIYLHTPAVHPVWPSFSDEPYVPVSTMGGRVWVDNGDGTFTQKWDRDDTYLFPKGLSALDLYVMGMIPPNEVPDTFILRDVQETERWDTVRATKVPVRIEDIVAAMGPRVPAADMSQKEFRLGLYLLHEDGRPPQVDLLERATAVSPAVAEYFARATGGRMRVIPTVTPPMTGPVVPGGSESFSISATTPYSLTVEWTEPENTGSAITDYDVRYREVGNGGDFTDARHEGTARTATLTGLRPGTAYEVQVRASNATGTGAWSQLGVVRTSPLQSGDHIYYFPHLAVGASWQTTITYINYSTQEVSCQTDFLSDQGSPLMVSFAGLGRVDSRSDVLPPGGSVHQETNVELSAPLAPGWARANCSGPVKASLLFRQFKGGMPVTEAGVNAAALPATRFVTFAEQGEGKFGTGVAYANPSATAAHVTFTARDAAGQTLASIDRTLLPGGHAAHGMSRLFGIPFIGSLEVTSTAPIVSLALNFESDPVFSSLPPGELDVSAQGPTTYYFPHLAVGASWQTTITYINYSPQEVSCQTDFISDHGSPLMVSFAGLGRVVSRSDVLPPGGSVHEETNVELSAPLAPGWARANCTGPVKASLLFRQHNSEGMPVAEGGVSAATVPATRFVTFAEQGEGQSGTGVAYANPSDTAALVIFTVRDAEGRVLASVNRTLLPRGHDAQNMVSLFDLSSFSGSLEITSTELIVSLSLNFEAGAVFSSLPPGDIPAGDAGTDTDGDEVSAQIQRCTYTPYKPLMEQVSTVGPVCVTGSSRVPQQALDEAGRMLEIMLSNRGDVGNQLRSVGALTAVFARSENVCDLPYFADLVGSASCQAEGGLGGVPGRPATACSEKNLLKQSDDPFGRGSRAGGENVCVHELAHTIMNVGLSSGERSQIQSRFNAPDTKALWRGDFALENADEFFAEMTQAYFCANPEVPSFLHTHGINCAEELRDYDRATYDLIHEILRGAADLR